MGLREIKKDRTRQDILDTARRSFLRRGFDRTRIRDIADRLQVSEQTVFNYFPSKQALVEAMAEAWVAESAQNATLYAAKPASDSSVLARGRRNLARYFEGLGSQRDLLRLLLDHSSFGGLQPTRRERTPHDSALVRASRAQREMFGMGYRSAQQAGELRPDVDPDELAEMVLAIIGTCLRTWVDSKPAPDLLELTFRRVGLLMDGARVGPPLDVKRALAEVRGEK